MTYSLDRQFSFRVFAFFRNFVGTFVRSLLLSSSWGLGLGGCNPGPSPSDNKEARSITLTLNESRRFMETYWLRKVNSLPCVRDPDHHRQQQQQQPCDEPRSHFKVSGVPKGKCVYYHYPLSVYLCLCE